MQLYNKRQALNPKLSKSGFALQYAHSGPSCSLNFAQLQTRSGSSDLAHCISAGSKTCAILQLLQLHSTDSKLGACPAAPSLGAIAEHEQIAAHPGSPPSSAYSPFPATSGLLPALHPSLVQSQVLPALFALLRPDSEDVQYRVLCWTVCGLHVWCPGCH